MTHDEFSKLCEDFKQAVEDDGAKAICISVMLPKEDEFGGVTVFGHGRGDHFGECVTAALCTAIKGGADPMELLLLAMSNPDAGTHRSGSIGEMEDEN